MRLGLQNKQTKSIFLTKNECVGEVDKKMMKKITKAVQIQVGVYEESN